MPRLRTWCTPLCTPRRVRASALVVSAKQRWFENGAAAFERVTGRPPGGYVCPLCLRVCTTLEDVKFEHAPPASVGGRRVCLTCDECNSTGGHSLDAELSRAERTRSWSRGTLGKPMRARAVVKGIPLNVDVDWRPEGVSIVGLPEYNDPANTAAHVSLATSGEPWVEPITITYQGYVEARARVGWLRSAYLVAFALMGYRYALQPELKIVRQQIQEPDATHIPRFSLHRGERESLTGTTIAWLTHPPAPTVYAPRSRERARLRVFPPSRRTTCDTVESRSCICVVNLGRGSENTSASATSR